jgi:hypothetical protein
MKTTTVTVTRKHYTAANKAEDQDVRSKTCIVAQALKDIFPKDADISVRFTTAQVTFKDGSSKTFDLSAKGANLISKYDNHVLRVKDLPVTFRMTEQRSSVATA